MTPPERKSPHAERMRERRARVLELHRRGCNPAQIALRLRLTAGWVREILRGEGLEPNPGGLEE